MDTDTGALGGQLAQDEIGWGGVNWGKEDICKMFDNNNNIYIFFYSCTR